MASKDNKYIVDNLEITPKTIQTAFANARLTSRTNEVLSEAFRMLQLLKRYEINPSDATTKQAIKNIVNSGMLKPQYD